MKRLLIGVGAALAALGGWLARKGRGKDWPR
jgi:hypothetical protein